MNKFRVAAVWIAKHPGYAMAILGVCLIGMLWKIQHLEIDSTTRGMMDENDPKHDVYENFKQLFGSDILSVLVIEAPSGKDVFTPKTLTLIENLTDEIYELDGVVSIQSLTTVTNLRGEDEFLNTDRLVDGVPEDPQDLETIRRNALENETFVGNVVSADGRFAALNIYTEHEDEDKQFDKRFVGHMQELIDQYGGDHLIYSVGGPRFNVTFNHSIELDQVTLVPLAVLMILSILFLVFRGPVAVSLPVVTGSISIAATVGFMCWMGYSIGVVSVMVPSILIVVGCTEDVHLISEFHHLLRSGKNPKEAVVIMAREGILPISLTSLTTMLGFGALALNDITALREFGIIACFGLFANYLITIVMVPAVLRLSRGAPEKDNRINRFMAATLNRTVNININHRNMIGGLIIVLMTVAIAGCLRLEVNNDPISYFKSHSDIRRDFSKIHEDMAGAQSFQIVFETLEPEDVKQPQVIAYMAELQDYMTQLGLFDKMISLADFIKMMNREINSDPQAFNVPKASDTIAEYLLLLDNDDMFRYIDSDAQSAAMVVRHNMSGSKDVNAALDLLQTYINNNLTHYAVDGEIRKLNIYFTGESILLHSATDAMIRGQVKSLSMALFTILCVVSLLFLSLKAGLIALFSNLIPITFNFGLMGWLGIPFNTGTCLVATIALGIAVDDTIHFMVRYQRELHLVNDQQKAMARAVRGEGAPMMVTSLALCAGFAMMMFSQFVPSMHLGFLSALIMLYALFTDLFVNPVLLISVQLINLWDYVALKISKHTREGSLILKGLRDSEIKKVVLLGSLRKVERDQIVVREGDKGEEMYLILSGLIRVYLEQDKDKTITTMSEGMIFGEMALMTTRPRAASVEALYDLELLRIDEKALQRITTRYPRIAAKLYANMTRVLSERVAIQTHKA